MNCLTGSASEGGYMGIGEGTAEPQLDSFLSILPDRNARFYSMYRRLALLPFNSESFSKLAGDWAFVAAVLQKGKMLVVPDSDEGYIKLRGGISEKPDFVLSHAKSLSFFVSPYSAFVSELPRPLRRRRWKGIFRISARLMLQFLAEVRFALFDRSRPK